MALIGGWEWLPQAGVRRWSDNLFRIHGLEPDDSVPDFDFIVARTHPDDRGRLRSYFEAVPGAPPPTPLERRIRHEHGGIRHLRTTITLVESGAEGPTRIIGIVQDVTEEHNAAREIAAYLAVARMMAEWDSRADPVRDLLAAFGGGAFGAVFGALWLPEGDRLRPATTWSDPTLELAEFEVATAALGVAESAMALPRVALRTTGPVSVTDVTQKRWFRRRHAAERAGLRGGVAFPAMHGEQVVAMFEFYRRDPLEPSRRRDGTLEAIGGELGGFLSRRLGQLGAPRLTARQLAVLQLAAEGLTAPQIAAELGLRASTVRTHFDHVYAKFGVTDRGAAIAHGVRLGLIR